MIIVRPFAAAPTRRFAEIHYQVIDPDFRQQAACFRLWPHVERNTP